MPSARLTAAGRRMANLSIHDCILLFVMQRERSPLFACVRRRMESHSRTSALAVRSRSGGNIVFSIAGAPIRYSQPSESCFGYRATHVEAAVVVLFWFALCAIVVCIHVGERKPNTDRVRLRLVHSVSVQRSQCLDVDLRSCAQNMTKM